MSAADAANILMVIYASACVVVFALGMIAGLKT